jgi:hypothetical protein
VWLLSSERKNKILRRKKEGRREGRKEGRQAPVVQTCNPNYLGGRDQEDWGWRPVPGKITQHKKELVECLKCRAPI